MKRIISLILIAILALVPLSVSAQEDVTVLLDGEAIQFDQPPVIMSGRTMVPVRAIYEALGAEVKWDDQTKTASGTKCGITVSFTIDVAKVVINYNEKEIDAPATIVNSRTLVPVRALAEGFGVHVDWDGDTRTVLLTSSNNTGIVENHIGDGDLYDYTGQILNGIPHGYGTGVLKEYNDTYFVGSWENGSPAVGMLITNDVSVGFTGFCGYAYGQAQGYSEVMLSSGMKYYGTWANNMINGYGEFYLPDGSYYKGSFKDNTMEGYGEYFDVTTGLTHKGTWSNGELISEE